jgi:hypothetical protein
VIGWRVRSGNYGDVTLDGVNVAAENFERVLGMEFAPIELEMHIPFEWSSEDSF